MRTLSYKVILSAAAFLHGMTVLQSSAAEVYFDTISTEKAVRSHGAYFGVFGGGASGTDADLDNSYRAMSVNEKGGWFAGAEFGYEFHTPFPIRPAWEVELFYVDTKFLAEGGGESARSDLQHLNLMTNLVLALDLGANSNEVGAFAAAFHPYIGAGIGGAYVSEKDRVEQLENGKSRSSSDASDFTFAYQVFAGLEFDLGDYVSVYGEYRRLVLQELGNGLSNFSENLWGVGLKVKY